MQSFIPKFIILCIGILPLISPTLLSINFLSASPESLKTAWAVFFISFSMILWVVDQARKKQLTFISDRIYYPIFGFLIWCYLSLLWSQDLYMAILLLAQFTSYALIFLLIINAFKERKFVDSLLKSIILSMMLVSIIGLLQYYFPEIEAIQNFFMQTAVPGATFANKNMASHFIVMTLPLSLVYFLNSKNKTSVLIYSLPLIIGSWFLIYTSARQAYVAILVELTVLGIFFLLDFYKHQEKSLLSKLNEKIFKKILLFFILVFLFLASNLSSNGLNFNKGNKLNQVQSINIQGGNARIPAWVNSIEIIKDNFLTGVGVGQWEFIYPKYYDNKMKDVIFNEKVKLQRLHNDYLEMFANVGLIGYLFLIWLLFLTAKMVFRILSNQGNEYRYQVLGLGLGLLGFSIVALFSFPIRVYLPAFLAMSYIAIIVLLYRHEAHDLTIRLNGRILKRFIYSLVVIFGLAFSFYSYKWVMSEHYKGLALMFSNSPNELLEVDQKQILTISHALKSIKSNKLQEDSYVIVGEALFDAGKERESELYFKKIIDLSPYNTAALLKLAEIYGNQNNPKALNKQLKVLEFILSFDSRNVTALSYLTKNLLISGRRKDAATTYSRLKGSFEYFKNRSNFGPYHGNVGYIASSVGDYNYAKYIYQDAIKKFPTAENYSNLAVIEYEFLKNIDKGIKYAKIALELDPNISNSIKIKALIQEYESITKH